MSTTAENTRATNDERVRTVMTALSQGLSGDMPLSDMQLRDVARALDDLEREGLINPVEKGAMWKAVNWSDDIAPFIAAKDSSQAELYRSATLDELRKIESPALTSSPHFPGARKTLEDYYPKHIERVAQERFQDAQSLFADALGAIKRGDLAGADARRDQVTAALDDSLRYRGGEQGLVKMALSAAALASDPGKGNEAYHAYAHLIGLQASIDDYDAKHPDKRLLSAKNRELLESVEADIVKRLNIRIVDGSIQLPDGSLLPIGSSKMSIDPVDGTYGFTSKQLKPYEALLSEMEHLRDSFAERGNVSLGAGPVRRGAAMGIIDRIDELRTLVNEGNLDRIAQFVKENGLQAWKDKPGSLRQEADQLTALDAWHNRFFKNAHALMEATGFVPAIAAAKIMDNIIQGQRKGLSDGEITKNFAVDLISELGVKKLTGAAGTMGGKAVAEFTRNVATEFAKDPSVEGMSKALGNSFYKAVTGTITKDALKTLSPEQSRQLREFLVDAASKVGAVELVKPYLEQVFPRNGQRQPDVPQANTLIGGSREALAGIAAADAASVRPAADPSAQRIVAPDALARYDTASAAIDKSGVLRDPGLAESKENLTAALALAAARQNLDRIDAVMISKDGSRLIAVQGDPLSDFHKTAAIVIPEAAKQPAGQSLALIAPGTQGNSAEPVKQQSESSTIAATQTENDTRGNPKVA